MFHELLTFAAGQGKLEYKFIIKRFTSLKSHDS